MIHVYIDDIAGSYNFSVQSARAVKNIRCPFEKGIGS